MQCFAWKGRQYIEYEILPRITTEITQDAKPKIVDACLSAHFHDGAVTMSLFLLSITAAKTLVMDRSDQFKFELAVTSTCDPRPGKRLCI